MSDYGYDAYSDEQEDGSSGGVRAAGYTPRGLVMLPGMEVAQVPVERASIGESLADNWGTIALTGLLSALANSDTKRSTASVLGNAGLDALAVAGVSNAAKNARELANAQMSNQALKAKSNWYLQNAKMQDAGNKAAFAQWRDIQKLALQGDRNAILLMSALNRANLGAANLYASTGLSVPVASMPSIGMGFRGGFMPPFLQQGEYPQGMPAMGGGASPLGKFPEPVPMPPDEEVVPGSGAGKGAKPGTIPYDYNNPLDLSKPGNHPEGRQKYRKFRHTDEAWPAYAWQIAEYGDLPVAAIVRKWVGYEPRPSYWAAIEQYGLKPNQKITNTEELSRLLAAMAVGEGSARFDPKHIQAVIEASIRGNTPAQAPAQAPAKASTKPAVAPQGQTPAPEVQSDTQPASTGEVVQIALDALKQAPAPSQPLQPQGQEQFDIKLPLPNQSIPPFYTSEQLNGQYGTPAISSPQYLAMAEKRMLVNDWLKKAPKQQLIDIKNGDLSPNVIPMDRGVAQGVSVNPKYLGAVMEQYYPDTVLEPPKASKSDVSTTINPYARPFNNPHQLPFNKKLDTVGIPDVVRAGANPVQDLLSGISYGRDQSIALGARPNMANVPKKQDAAAALSKQPKPPVQQPAPVQPSAPVAQQAQPAVASTQPVTATQQEVSPSASAGKPVVGDDTILVKPTEGNQFGFQRPAGDNGYEFGGFRRKDFKEKPLAAREQNAAAMGLPFGERAAENKRKEEVGAQTAYLNSDEGKANAELRARAFKRQAEIRDEAERVRRAEQKIKGFEGLFANGYQTGKWTEYKNELSKVAEAFGVDASKLLPNTFNDANAASTFTQLVYQQIFETLLAQKGAQSDMDAHNARLANHNNDATTKSNIWMTQLASNYAEIAQIREDFYNEALENRHYSLTQTDKMWKKFSERLHLVPPPVNEKRSSVTPPPVNGKRISVQKKGYTREELGNEWYSPSQSR